MQVIAQNPKNLCPAEVFAAQRALAVAYYDFAGTPRNGRIIVHESVAEDVAELFELLLELGFPLRSVIPASDPRFEWDDEKMMREDNSSGFNYRFIGGTRKLSSHAFGLAVDLNPLENPYITARGISPEGSSYDPDRPGTIVADGPIVKFLENRGWTWGGRWKDMKDYQHFEKPLRPGRHIKEAE